MDEPVPDITPPDDPTQDARGARAPSPRRRARPWSVAAAAAGVVAACLTAVAGSRAAEAVYRRALHDRLRALPDAAYLPVRRGTVERLVAVPASVTLRGSGLRDRNDPLLPGPRRDAAVSGVLAAADAYSARDWTTLGRLAEGADPRAVLPPPLATAVKMFMAEQDTARAVRTRLASAEAAGRSVGVRFRLLRSDLEEILGVTTPAGVKPAWYRDGVLAGLPVVDPAFEGAVDVSSVVGRGRGSPEGGPPEYAADALRRMRPAAEACARDAAAVTEESKVARTRAAESRARLSALTRRVHATLVDSVLAMTEPPPHAAAEAAARTLFGTSP